MPNPIITLDNSNLSQRFLLMFRLEQGEERCFCDALYN